MDFGARAVIRDLSFDVQRGETFGFLGGNGSGKTTTIRALLGIHRATAGTLHINGRPFGPTDGAMLGYLPEERGLYRKEPVLDVMVYFGRLKGMGRRDAVRWSRQYLERVGLDGKAGDRLDKLSGGQQQKVQLGVTVMSSPSLLILDEPTKGFDPVNRHLLMEIIGEQKAAGATVLMVTHHMDEVERLCDRILLLRDGTAHAYGSVKDVQASYGGRTVTLTYAGKLRQLGSLHGAYSVLANEASGDGNAAQLQLEDSAREEDVLASLLDMGLPVTSYAASRRSLEEIFMRVYGTDIEGSTNGRA
ncbi:ABC transporter ATP-binding protein [Arthrobacter caoxuetaonis]|uniref:ATP-binding cassette domain-containing protein n=1 Tax=Arthrobacter caoxuetaonis TaxID=2886935 RepID=A0A9X1MID5_9MICC|nr:ATP-binding cassette domain-containing protein [Arthrobacter caoxuetaonis]MCC3299760.1 ATP-binding cassette domain-containing protein [Arthrobacter caoxuetaonis]USQ59405.1 ATP-binding cassette domain-containing protein [Arthrobacter caoxuetaonis]